MALHAALTLPTAAIAALLPAASAPPGLRGNASLANAAKRDPEGAAGQCPQRRSSRTRAPSAQSAVEPRLVHGDPPFVRHDDGFSGRGPEGTGPAKRRLPGRSGRVRDVRAEAG